MAPFLRWAIAFAALSAGAWVLFWAPFRSADIPVETISQGHHSPQFGTDGPGLCPWRQSRTDMQAFFPGANRYTTQTLFLSGLRLPILRRLGHDSRLDSNVLYVYAVQQGHTPRGAVLVDRAAGEYGAIEVVVGVDNGGRVAGVRLQRYREPPEVARAILSARWLGAFRGKTANSSWRMGNDIPAVPPLAETSAEVVVRTVRALMIEADVAHRSIQARK